ncbi:MAG: MFS transporter [Janthinobacterium lividum]
MIQEQEQPHQVKSGGLNGLRQPNLALLHGGMLLSGFGTVFLGPVLPTLAANAQVSDTGSGLFFTAQFIGAFFGGVTTSRRLWWSLLRGSGAAVVGFLLLSLCTRQQAPALWDAAALLPLGFGVGQMLTSINLLAARRFAAQRGAALSLVNFSWSLGAVLAPFALGSLLPTTALHMLLLVSAGLFAVAFLAAAVNMRLGTPESSAVVQAALATGKLPMRTFVYFAALLLLYGGVETSLSGWVTTFGTRYGSHALQSSALGEAALWIGLTSGRALTPVLLRFVKERMLLQATLAAAAVLTVTLSLSHGGPAIMLVSALMGFSLAPWFPLVLSGMLGEGAAAGQVGTIIAVSGIGAATLPLLVGAVSRSAGSLRTAMLVPLAGLLLLLALSFRQAQGVVTEPAESV